MFSFLPILILLSTQRILEPDDFLDDLDDEDYEDVEINLPESVLFELEDEDDIEEWYEHKENGDEDDFLSDKLSDEYDFCVNSFEYKIID